METFIKKKELTKPVFLSANRDFRAKKMTSDQTEGSTLIRGSGRPREGRTKILNVCAPNHKPAFLVKQTLTVRERRNSRATPTLGNLSAPLPPPPRMWWDKDAENPQEYRGTQQRHQQAHRGNSYPGSENRTSKLNRIQTVLHACCPQWNQTRNKKRKGISQHLETNQCTLTTPWVGEEASREIKCPLN